MGQYTNIEELYELYVKCGQKICTDTRKLIPGSIFFALKGDSFNANTFAQKAIEEGCAYAVIDDVSFCNKKTLLVNNVLEALQQLANYHRKQLNIPVIGITGSNGKTTNKELIHAVLSKKYQTLATIGNLNNHIGVPLTLLSIGKKHEIAIVEMGANHQGEIDLLCRIAEPDFGIITNIGKAHLEGFGGIEGVKKGKSEMYRFIEQKKGCVFINADDAVLNELAAKNTCISYGTSESSDIVGKTINESEYVVFKWWEKHDKISLDELPKVKTQIIGHYNFINLLCAACVGHYFKVSTEKINEALSEYVPSMNRSQIEKTKYNTLILDAYNANPSSMKAAIENFADMSGENKLLILGDMFELGDYASEEHKKIIELLQLKKLTNVLLIGNEFEKLKNSDYKTFTKTETCLSYLQESKVKNNIILIKGSRGMKLETLKEAL